MTDQEQQQIERHKQLIADYKVAFRGEAGARVLADMRDFCNFYDHCMRPTDRETCFALGRRDVYLRILALLEESLLEEVQKYTQEVTDDG